MPLPTLSLVIIPLSCLEYPMSHENIYPQIRIVAFFLKWTVDDIIDKK
jgi:hypothetical protein